MLICSDDDEEFGNYLHQGLMINDKLVVFRYMEDVLPGESESSLIQRYKYARYRMIGRYRRLMY